MIIMHTVSINIYQDVNSTEQWKMHRTLPVSFANTDTHLLCSEFDITFLCKVITLVTLRFGS